MTFSRLACENFSVMPGRRCNFRQQPLLEAEHSAFATMTCQELQLNHCSPSNLTWLSAAFPYSCGT